GRFGPPGTLSGIHPTDLTKVSCVMAAEVGNRPSAVPTVIIQQPGSSRARTWLLTLLLIASMLANYGMYTAYHDYFAQAEGPSTWTGAIGVLVPHYEVTESAEKIGFTAAPLKTG